MQGVADTVSTVESTVQTVISPAHRLISSVWLGVSGGWGNYVGLIGRATTRLDPDGKVFVRGEYWSVNRDDLETDPIGPGEAVEVTAVEGMRLRVRRVQRGA